MIPVDRTDPSVIARWWWTVDRWTMAALVLLAGAGIVLTVTASPAMAERRDLGEWHFVIRHMVFLLPALAVMLAVSLLTPRDVRRLAVVVLALSLVGVAATLLVGKEVNGATRWLAIGPLTVQPSEFVKPCFAVVAAWLFAEARRGGDGAGYNGAILLFLTITLLLLAQPDLGMTVVVAAVWGVQFFLAGLSIWLVGGLAVAAIGGMIGSYYLFDHVASRIDRFLDPAAGDRYQIDRSLEAFRNGGLLGTGPGEGTVKLSLPDAHTDFIFAVAGEEFGALWCLALVGLFALVMLRGLRRVREDEDGFVIIATVGLVALFAVQAVVNMASSLHLIPTKGMTLPFVSYGGSSLLAVGLGMGMVLALTRRRPSRWTRR